MLEQKEVHIEKFLGPDEAIKLIEEARVYYEQKKTELAGYSTK